MILLGDPAQLPAVSQRDIFGTHHKVNEQCLDRVCSTLPQDNNGHPIRQMVFAAAGAASTARQVASLSSYNSEKSDPPHYVSMYKRKVGVEVKCDRPVYGSTPNIC